MKSRYLGIPSQLPPWPSLTSFRTLRLLLFVALRLDCAGVPSIQPPTIHRGWALQSAALGRGAVGESCQRRREGSLSEESPPVTTYLGLVGHSSSVPTAETSQWGDTVSCEGAVPDPRFQASWGWRAMNYLNPENRILFFLKLPLFTSHKRSCGSNSSCMNIYQKPDLKSHNPIFAGNELQICSGTACSYDQARNENNIILLTRAHTTNTFWITAGYFQSSRGNRISCWLWITCSLLSCSKSPVFPLLPPPLPAGTHTEWKLPGKDVILLVTSDAIWKQANP